MKRIIKYTSLYSISLLFLSLLYWYLGFFNIQGVWISLLLILFQIGFVLFAIKYTPPKDNGMFIEITLISIPCYFYLMKFSWYLSFLATLPFLIPLYFACQFIIILRKTTKDDNA